jgi:hypothetical protein
MPPRTWRSGSLQSLQMGADPRDGGGAWISPVPKIEDKPGIAHGVAAESRGGNVTLATELLYLSQQVHGSVLIGRSDSAACPFPTHFLLT